MIKRCYKEKEFIPRIEQALHINMPPYTCHVVDQNGMSKVMGKAGWKKSDTHGVVGFHLDEDVYVLKSADWTTLHELIHRAGVNADRINRVLAEGLTELIASNLKKGKDEHRSTYPKERKWVTNLLKKLKMSPIELGQIIVHAPNPPRAVAELISARGLSKKSIPNIARSFVAQGKNEPSFNISTPTKLSGPDYPAYAFFLAFGIGLTMLIRRPHARPI